jgi:hypothetical protein
VVNVLGQNVALFQSNALTAMLTGLPFPYSPFVVRRSPPRKIFFVRCARSTYPPLGGSWFASPGSLRAMVEVGGLPARRRALDRTGCPVSFDFSRLDSIKISRKTGRIVRSQGGFDERRIGFRVVR